MRRRTQRRRVSPLECCPSCLGDGKNRRKEEEIEEDVRFDNRG